MNIFHVGFARKLQTYFHHRKLGIKCPFMTFIQLLVVCHFKNNGLFYLDYLREKNPAIFQSHPVK